MLGSYLLHSIRGLIKTQSAANSEAEIDQIPSSSDVWRTCMARIVFLASIGLLVSPLSELGSDKSFDEI